MGGNFDTLGVMPPSNLSAGRKTSQMAVTSSIRCDADTFVETIRNGRRRC